MQDTNFIQRLWRGLILGMVWANALASLMAADLLQRYEFCTGTGRDRAVLHLPRAATAPAIDGDLADEVWKGAYQTTRLTAGGGRAGSNATTLLLGYDSDNLYLAARCAVADSARLKTKYPKDLEHAAAWGDDCIDFKFSPNSGRTTFQFIVTAAGAYYCARNGEQGFRAQWRRAVRVGKNDFVIETAISLASLGITSFQPGTAVLFNLGRHDTTTRELTTLTEPYGDIRGAPLLILGTAAEHQTLQSSNALLRDAQIVTYLDRDQYPSFERMATGRVKLISNRSSARLSGKPALLLSLLRAGQVIKTQRIEPVLADTLDFDLPLAGLEPGAYQLQVRVADGAETLPPVCVKEFILVPESAPRTGEIPVSIPPGPGDLAAWPVTFGVPFPWGALDSPENVRLVDAAGREVPCQVAVTGRWSRTGSVRWLLVDCILPASTKAQSLKIVYGPTVRRQVVDAALRLEDSAEAIRVSTGPLRFAVPKRQTPGLSQLWLDRNGNGTFDGDEQLLLADPAAGPSLVDAEGTVYRGNADPEAEVVIECAGPLRACVRVSGWHVSETGQKKLGQFILRYHAYAGLPYVRAFHTFIITAGSNAATVGTPPGTPGTEEVRYRNIAYTLPLRNQFYFFGTPKIGTGYVRNKGDSAYLLQRDAVRCRLYANGVFTDQCQRAEGWVSAGTANASLTLAVKDFWQQFPKELEVQTERLVVHLWPAHCEPPVDPDSSLSPQTAYHQRFAHEGILDFKIPPQSLEYVKAASQECYPGALASNAIGLAKTHEMLLHFHVPSWEDARARTVARTFQANPTATCAPDWVCSTQVFGNMQPVQPGRFERIEHAMNETIANIFRLQEQDADYGIFNFGDAHHNWNWQDRRWDIHRIWRNTHHGWTRWPWLTYARSGRKDLFDWADRNARHVADVDHCHYATRPFIGLPWPRGKCVGGICDYKGFVHWASGARLCYNSAADAMLHHYYFTGDQRSRTTALEHGAALLADGAAQVHREGAGRVTSALALYFETWDNRYLDFIERTIDALLGTQAEDGSFPQWEDFAPFLQRYVELTRSRRGMRAMTRWADSVCLGRQPHLGYTAKISILAHANLYSGDVKYLRTAAYRVNASVDNQYFGEDARYRGMFIVGHSNLDQSYLLQWIPYYLAALARHGVEPEPEEPDRTQIRTFDRVAFDAEQRAAWVAAHTADFEKPYLWQARLRQSREAEFALRLELAGYPGQRFMAEVCVAEAGSPPPVRSCAANPTHQNRTTLDLKVPRDSALEYHLRVYADNNFSVRVPVTYAQTDFREVYPFSSGGITIGDGLRYYFTVPEEATGFTLRYKGRAWPLRARLFAPTGQCVAEDTWIGSNALYQAERRVGAPVDRTQREGWSFSVSGYGQASLLEFRLEPATAHAPIYFALGKDKLFAPGK